MKPEMPYKCSSQESPGDSHKQQHEVADVFRLYGQAYREKNQLSEKQQRVMYNIEHCRTTAFGYHVDVCEACGHRDPFPNSCRDRHCPKCQGISQRKWVNMREEDILPVPYYHVVFTLPHHLFPLSLYNKALIYDLLFQGASETLIAFGNDPKWLGGELGFFGVLHTWGQSLWHHVHAHFIVPGGALGKDGTWIYPKYKGRFLFPVAALSKVFRGKFIEGLKRAYYDGAMSIPDDLMHLGQDGEFEKWVDELAGRNWVVYCKPPFGSAEQVVQYVGRYTHRVAISNRRLVSIDGGEVRFRYKEYKQSRLTWKEMTLEAEEFIQRFLWHILPAGFHKIRHYGFLANGRSKTKLARIREVLENKPESEEHHPSGETDGVLCPICRIGRLVPAFIIDRLGQTIIKNLSLLKAGLVFVT
jgi:hypothetical protein